MTIDEFFAGRDRSKQLFTRIAQMIGTIGDTTTHVSRSQIAFKRQRTVAVVWVPDQYLGGDHAPLVLTLPFAHRDPSTRWKQITKVDDRHFTHHLEVYQESDLDEQVEQWLRQAWDNAA